MRLGISSWTYPWAIGVAGFPPPARPIRLADLLERASVLKVGVVQVADNLPLHKLDAAEIRDARDQAASLGLTIEIGTRGVEPSHLRRYLKLAVRLGAVLVRTLTHTFKSRPSLEQAEKWIREVLPEFEAQGVTLGMENYEDRREMIELRIGHSVWGVGICRLHAIGCHGHLQVAANGGCPMALKPCGQKLISQVVSRRFCLVPASRRKIER